MVGKRRGILLPEPLREAAIMEEAGFVGIWDTDARADRVRCSPACARLYGLHPDDGLHGAPLDAFLKGCHPDDRDLLADAVAAAYADEAGLFEAEYRTIAESGRVHWVLARGRMTVDEDRRPLTSRGIVLDITGTRSVPETAGDETERLVNRLADHAIAQQHIVARLGLPRLKRLVDTLAFEVGRELARRLHNQGLGRLH